MTYLRDVAEYPLSLAKERDHRLSVSRYNGVQIRRRLTELGCVRQHRVVTGRRSGRGVLLEPTDAGRAQLEGAGIRIAHPRGLDHRRRYYAARLAAYARRSWPGAAVETSDPLDSADPSPDVTVRIPATAGRDGERSIAVVIVLADDVDVDRRRLPVGTAFDELLVCTETGEAAEALKKRASRLIPRASLRRVTFSSVGPFLSASPDPAEPAGSPRTAGSTRGRSRISRGEAAMLGQVLEAYRHLDDLDWLDASPLARIDAVRAYAMPTAPLPEAQALRRLLVDAARRAADHAAEIPAHAPLRVFLQRYVDGRRVTEIADELGVSREWCSRAYRKRALSLAGRHFMWLAAASRRDPGRDVESYSIVARSRGSAGR